MDKKVKQIKSGFVNAMHFFIAVLVIVIVIAAIMITVYIPSVTSVLEEHVQGEVCNAAISNAAATEAYFSGNAEKLKGFSARFNGVDLNSEDSIRNACIEIAAASGFRHVGLATVNGVTISSTGLTENTSHRAFVKEGFAGKPTHYANVNCDFDGALSDMYSVPVRDREGNIIGVLTGDSTPFSFAEVKMLGIDGDNTCFFIFDKNGSVVYTCAGNKADIELGDNIITRIDDENTANEIGYFLNNTLDDMYKPIKIDGVEYLSCFVDMPESQWNFAAIIPSQDVYSSFGSMITFTVLAIVLMVLLMAASVIAVTVKISSVSSQLQVMLNDALTAYYTDELTGHGNVAVFREKYPVSMKDTATGHAMISLDVDGFKAVNDLFGYEGGNDVIKKLSDIIERNIGKNDYFTRKGGDLFYIMKEFSDKSEIDDFANRIISDAEYQVQDIKLNLSIGIYIIDSPNINSRVAADRADIARDTVKNTKQSCFAFFDASMLEQLRREKRIEDIMEDSLALGEFVVYLQPKYALGESNDVVGAEALVRWLHDGKLIPPGDFIPVFEKNGFVTRIDYYMFEEVCKLQKKYISMGIKPKIISVNMSRVHINKTHFVADLADICDKYGVSTKYLEIEITESAAYENPIKLYEIFKEIKSYGFHVSIDDFGSGYSSLNMLKDLPVDVLKIDRSFLTKNADEHENASLIIGCVVSLASSLSIHTICEGIETKEQAVLLTKLGCNMAQGFFFARPMPVPEFEKLAYGISA